MDRTQLKARVAELLLPELVADKFAWYYVSIAGAKFQHGLVVKARGPHEAVQLMHGLNMWVEGCSTQTSEIPPDVEAKIPADQRWRKLNRKECEELGS